MSKVLRDERFSKDIQMLNGKTLNLILSATEPVLDGKAVASCKPLPFKSSAHSSLRRAAKAGKCLLMHLY